MNSIMCRNGSELLQVLSVPVSLATRFSIRDLGNRNPTPLFRLPLTLAMVHSPSFINYTYSYLISSIRSAARDHIGAYYVAAPSAMLSLVSTFETCVNGNHIHVRAHINLFRVYEPHVPYFTGLVEHLSLCVQRCRPWSLAHITRPRRQPISSHTARKIA